MSTEQPLVSVIMAAYNHEDYVAEAVESVLGQTYPNVELVAVDDASEDRTASILESYARSHPDRVRLKRGKASLGPTRRRNEALAMARGELICWLDSDDVWLPEKVAQTGGGDARAAGRRARLLEVRDLRLRNRAADPLGGRRNGPR